MFLHVFEEFVEIINDHDAEGLASLMTLDHKFIDSAGNTFSGKKYDGGVANAFQNFSRLLDRN